MSNEVHEYSAGEHTVRLRAAIQTTRDPFALILERCRDRKVLNVGAGGGIHGYLPGKPESWLHHRLLSVAQSVTGIDVDEDSVRYAQQHGYDLLVADCEDSPFNTMFDVIVISDVIEHLNSPGRALAHLSKFLDRGGSLILTTPNASAANLTYRAAFNKPLHVYWDHVATYLPEHIQVLGGRHGLQLSEVHFFDHFDARTATTRAKSRVFRAITKVAPRFASAFLAVLEPIR